MYVSYLFLSFSYKLPFYIRLIVDVVKFLICYKTLKIILWSFVENKCDN
uniref:MIP32608p1 n=1 Tax=Drosophila melanogaster TaxID=7227 RepID=G7H835_DROME|nr:MIP32608p1 [Drosophila melanogaster]